MTVAMNCYDGRKDKLGGGSQKVEGFLLCMTIQMSLIRRGRGGAVSVTGLIWDKGADS